MTDLISTEDGLIDQMTTPSEAVIEAVAKLDGPVLILGVGGKMGPTLAQLFVRAGCNKVTGVSRFNDSDLREDLEKTGVSTIQADLLDDEALDRLPDVPNILFLAGFKFGATGNESMTWAMNSWLPGRVLQRFSHSRIVYVSSGNVYAYTTSETKGAKENDQLGPIGEYAQSRLGGERIAAYFSQKQGTPLTLVRLFYATELRYGILHDIAWKIVQNEPIDLSMGYVNQIWQGDANAYLARLFPTCESPATVVNVTGQQVLSIRDISSKLADRLGKFPIFTGKEKDNALLGDAQDLFDQSGYPSISTDQMIEWVAHWVSIEGKSLGKPTKYDSRTGSF